MNTIFLCVCVRAHHVKYFVFVSIMGAPAHRELPCATGGWFPNKRPRRNKCRLTTHNFCSPVIEGGVRKGGTHDTIRLARLFSSCGLSRCLRTTIFVCAAVSANILRICSKCRKIEKSKQQTKPCNLPVKKNWKNRNPSS